MENKNEEDELNIEENSLGELNIEENPLGELALQKSVLTNSLWENIIMVTEDKIRLSLIEHLDNINNKSAWQTPLGLFLTIIITLLTTNFKYFIIWKEVWEAIFIIIGFLSFLWFCYTIYNYFKYDITIDKLIEDIKVSRFNNK